MLRYFPPFPSPNPASMRTSPLEIASIVPSPPLSSASSTPSPAVSTPATPLSPTGSERSMSERNIGRSRSRSAARRSVPPHTRILKQHGASSETSKATPMPQSPPLTPPETATSSLIGSPVEKASDHTERGSGSETNGSKDLGKSRKGSVVDHHYEDAVRIACGAWADTGAKKKAVTWGKKVPA